MTLSVKQLFVIDAVGAAVSAFMLGIVLPHFTELIGMPINHLLILAAFPVAFVLFDLFCYITRPQNGSLLLVIALANLGYCLLSGVFVLHSFVGLTGLGLAYFGAEILIIFGLVIIEIRTALQAIKASKE